MCEGVCGMCWLMFQRRDWRKAPKMVPHEWGRQWGDRQVGKCRRASQAEQQVQRPWSGTVPPCSFAEPQRDSGAWAESEGEWKGSDQCRPSEAWLAPCSTGQSCHAFISAHPFFSCSLPIPSFLVYFFLLPGQACPRLSPALLGALKSSTECVLNCL